MFDAIERSLATLGLQMRYHVVPWDEPAMGAPCVAVTDIAIQDQTAARIDFETFRQWCSTHQVVLVSCKLPHDCLVECGFLESQGFRFIELNYRPELKGLQLAELGPVDDCIVECARGTDEATIADMASKVFKADRFHGDPMIDSRIGDRRYRNWVTNAFKFEKQQVMKCLQNGQIVGFFVVEAPSQDHRFWSLVGLAPGLAGRGLATKVWRAMLRRHREEGVDCVSTSISSLNVRVANLYVKLGFRFPAPEITLHWCPRGQIPAAQ